MTLFSKKEVASLKKLVNKENREYHRKQSINYDSNLAKQNKELNNMYKIKKNSKLYFYL